MILLLLLAAAGATATEGNRPHTVLTSLQATYSIVAALVEGTGFEAVSVVTPRVRMARHAAYFDSAASGFAARAASAVAVVNIRGVWSSDPLYARARRHNIHVVPVDATVPLDGDSAGVSMVARRNGGGALPQAWLSPVNGMRMAEIVAADLKRLNPADSARIDANLERFRHRLFGIKRAGDDCIAGAEVPAVIALTDEFAYLTDAMNIEVTEYFLKAEEQWDAAEAARLRAVVAASGAPAILHKWQPEGAVMAAVRDSGAALFVLDTLDPPPAGAGGGMDPDGYAAGLERNLNLLCDALTGVRK